MTPAEYERAIEGASQFDLFIDATRPRNGRQFVAGARRAGGDFVTVLLTRHEAIALTELVVARAARRAADLPSLRTAQRPNKIIESARRKVDERIARYTWRSFQTVGGDSADGRSYLFRPAPGLRYAVLVRS
jgi:hypothetical protein